MELLLSGKKIFYHFKILKLCNAGGQSCCFLGKDERDEQLVFIKQYRDSDLIAGSKEAKALSGYYDTLRKLFKREQHRFCLPFYVGEANGSMITVFKNIQGKSLEDWQNDGLSQGQRMCLALSISNSIRIMHKKGVAHLDLSPQNILIEENINTNKLYSKIIDFDAAQIDGERRSRVLGNIFYCSPEHIAPDQYGEVSEKSDVFTLGILLFELLFEHHPFPEEDYLTAIENSNVNIPENSPYHGQVAKRVLACLQPHPENRPQAGWVHSTLYEYYWFEQNQTIYRDAERWQQAQALNTKEAYYQYLATCELCTKQELAEEILKQLEEQCKQEEWLNELLIWADVHNISEKQFPRNKQTVLAMEELTLYGNRLTELPESIGKLTNLTWLNLTNNQLTKLPESIGRLTNLTKLGLMTNRFTEIPESISKLTNLTWLNLTNNQLIELPESIGRLTNLTDLELRVNNLTELPESIGKLTMLNSLPLDTNKLTELPEFIGKLTNLTDLDLSNNQIAELPEFIGTLTNLTTLRLSDNKIAELPESIGKLTNLTELNLRGNQLTELPESIDKLTNLTYLDLRNNQIAKLPESIGKLTNLTYLDLSNNQIAKLPESIGKLTNLTRLDLKRNNLTELPESIGKLTNLTICWEDY